MGHLRGKTRLETAKFIESPALESTASKTGSRWRPGESGNPAGRPKGSRNKATVIAQQLIDSEAEHLVRSAIDRALGGDATCLRLCLERLLPAQKERPVFATLPALERATDVP